MTNIFNKQLIIILGISLVLIIGLFFVVAKPRFGTFKNRYKELSENQSKLAYLVAKKESLNKLKNEEKRIEEALKKAQNILPKQKETSDFLVILEAASKDTGNNLKSISMTEAPKQEAVKKEEEETVGKEKNQKEETKTTAPAPAYQTITFSIDIEGDFKQLLDFLTLSESLSRFVTFPSLTVSTKANLLETKLEGEIYFK